MEKNKKLGETLKAYRERAFVGWGLRRVASDIGIDYAHLFRIEAGQYIPADENLLKLLDAYKVDQKEKLDVFNMARLTPSHQEVINQAFPHYKSEKDFAGAFYRQSKKTPDNKKK